MKKWILAGAAVLVAAVLAVIGYELANGLRPARGVGFQQIQIAEADRAPLSVGLWYPTDASPRPMLLGWVVQFVARHAPVAGERLPLVVISHGNGGGPGSHADTAVALAAAGFVVAAPMHSGDNFVDQSAVGTSTWLIDRARHLRLVIDYLSNTWSERARLDVGRIGVFGFSAGGFTALTMIGAVPDVAAITRHCARQPELACQLWNPDKAPLPAVDAFVADDRVRAAVVVAPGYGFAFPPDTLTAVTVPVQLWSGERDTHVPTASNAGLVRASLGDTAQLHIVTGAQHFSFLAPCGLIGPPPLCREHDGFDRRRFHERFNADVVAFFRSKLGLY